MEVNALMATVFIGVTKATFSLLLKITSNFLLFFDEMGQIVLPSLTRLGTITCTCSQKNLLLLHYRMKTSCGALSFCLLRDLWCLDEHFLF